MDSRRSGNTGKATEQEVAVGLTAPEELMLNQGESHLPGPGGAVLLEGDGERGDLASVTTKKKKNGLLRRVSVSAAFVLLLAVTGWMAYKKVLAPLLKPPLPGVPGVDEQIVLYSIKLFEARDALDVAWAAASDRVKKAFVSNYMPSSERGQVRVDQALSFYKLHVLELSAKGAPSKDEEEYVKKQYHDKQLFLFSILDAAARRLEGLRHMEEDTRLPAIILGRGKRSSAGREGKIAVGLFLDKLKESGFEYSPRVGLGGEQGVSLTKVDELLELLEMEEKLASLDKKTQEAFEVLLEGHGLSLKTLRPEDIEKMEEIKLPRDSIATDVQTFVTFLHVRYNASHLEAWRNKLLNDVVGKWSEQAVDEAIEAVRAHHKEILENRLQEKRAILAVASEEPPAIPLTHAYPLAVFLV